MKIDKIQLVIFEKDRDIIEIWQDFFSENYTLNFVNINSNNILNKGKFNSKTIFICNIDKQINGIDNIKNNMIILLTDKKKVSNTKSYKEFKQKRCFTKPISLREIDKEIYYAYYLKGNEKICIKNFFLFPLDRKLLLPDNENFILLTEKEVSILIELSKSKKTITKEELLTNIWGYNSEIKTTTLETHVHRLRQKLKKFSEKKIMIKTTKSGYYI